MADDVVFNKCASIERCVKRAQEEYAKDSASFAQDFTRQDAAILNIQRACEAALDLGQHIVRRDKLGLPQSARDVFQMLASAGYIPLELAQQLQKMVGFRNLAVHDYQSMQLPIVVSIIEHHLPQLLQLAQIFLQKHAQA